MSEFTSQTFSRKAALFPPETGLRYAHTHTHLDCPEMPSDVPGSGVSPDHSEPVSAGLFSEWRDCVPGLLTDLVSGEGWLSVRGDEDIEGQLPMD
jgi:hypothetical protein